MAMKIKNETLKLTRAEDGDVTVSSKSGDVITLPREAGSAVARYFDDGKDVAFVFGALFAPAGSSKKSRLRIVSLVPAALLPGVAW
jgi:hypothetical protein